MKFGGRNFQGSLCYFVLPLENKANDHDIFNDLNKMDNN